MERRWWHWNIPNGEPTRLIIPWAMLFSPGPWNETVQLTSVGRGCLVHITYILMQYHYFIATYLFSNFRYPQSIFDHLHFLVIYYLTFDQNIVCIHDIHRRPPSVLRHVLYLASQPFHTARLHSCSTMIGQTCLL